MNTQEKVEAAGKKKEEGNALFKAGKYQRASKRYEKVRMIHAHHDEARCTCSLLNYRRNTSC